MITKLAPVILCALILDLGGCKQDSAPSTVYKARASYSPYGGGEELPLRWNDSHLSSGISLKIASEVASILDFGEGQNAQTDAATEWNNALPGKTLYTLPIPTVANRDKAQLLSYHDDEMGIYQSQNWFSEVGAGALAITQFFGLRRTSASGQYIELQHADIILNYRDYAFSSDPEDFTTYDLPSVLLHEMGHFVGLRHEYSTYESVMRPSLGSYESERELYPIDIQNLENNYQISQTQQLSANQEPGNGVYSGAITSPEQQESELVQGRFELRANGQCAHFINGQQVAIHPVELGNNTNLGL
ncbi:MAG: matrixin family metalloprotease [Bdellovibrio sp.]|nr:matrixin family metalloprotease [Bdellovibrio sp.]